MRLYFTLFFYFNLSIALLGQSKPNIILFLVDDMGWMDTSVPFGDSIQPRNRLFKTPNMERLAGVGMRFAHAYATPVCTPTRISLLTGMNAAQHGVTNWTSPWKNDPTDSPDEQFSPAPWRVNGLSPIAGIPGTVHATPLPQLLKEAGYFTIHVGKAHWGPMGTPGANPYNLGFMVNISGHSAGHPQSFLGTQNFGNLPGKASVQAVPDLEEYYGTDTFLTEAHTLEAIKSLQAPLQNGQPFFLHLAHYAVHVPLDPDNRFVQKYMDAGRDSAEARYAALVEGMDKSLGDLMDFLEKKGVAKNTILLFMSDNGGLSLAPPRQKPAHTHNLPLRAGKGSLYEGGIRVPMLVYWPGVTRAGSRSEYPVQVEDFFPSILEMAKIRRYHTVQEVSGRSFVPALRNPELRDPQRVLLWHYPNKWIGTDGPGINYHSAIRQGDWKLLHNLRNGHRELYQLREDPGEQKDLSSEFPERVRALSALLDARLSHWKAPMPVPRDQ